MSSDSSFNIHNALYFVKYPSRPNKTRPRAAGGPRSAGLKTPGLHEALLALLCCGDESLGLVAGAVIALRKIKFSEK